MTRTLLMTLCLCACEPRIPDPGTFVGNPGKARIKAALTVDLQVTALDLSDGTLVATDCAQQASEPVAVRGVDLDNPISLPAGEWCALTFTLDDDTVLQAEGSGGGTVELPLVVPTLQMSSVEPVDLAAAAWVLELADEGWIDADTLGVIDGEHLTLDPHGVKAEAAAARVVSGSALYEDSDRDGAISDSEREAGPTFVTRGR